MFLNTYCTHDKLIFKMATLSTYSNVLGRRHAAHLLRRTTYHYTIKQVKALAAMTPAQALKQLLVPAKLTIPGPLSLDKNQSMVFGEFSTNDELVTQQELVLAWWTGEAQKDATITHRMMTFLHSTFTARIDAAKSPKVWYDHLSLLRYYTLGNFKTFAKKMATDVCMLFFLDNFANTKDQPNENWAREFLEVFAIGKGGENYTEEDIRQTARVFTGFNNGTPNSITRGKFLDTETGIYRGGSYLYNHDAGNKTFSQAFQNTTILGAQSDEDMWREMDDYVNMVFVQPAAAKFLSRRLYRFFVRDTISDEIEKGIITPLANLLLANDYELKPALEKLLSSKHFYDVGDDGKSDNEIVGALIKSPMELMFQGVSVFEPNVPHIRTRNEIHYQTYWHAMQEFFVSAGMRRFLPENVAGFPAYFQEPGYSKLWFNASTMIARYQLPELLLTHENFNKRFTKGGIKIDIVGFVRDSGHFPHPEIANELVQTFIDYFLPEAVTEKRFQYFLEALLNGLSSTNWKFEWNDYLQSGNDASVYSALSNFIKTLMASPEYQLF